MNYHYHNLIGPYHFWVIRPRNFTLFTRLFLAGEACGLGTRLGEGGERREEYFFSLQLEGMLVNLSICLWLLTEVLEPHSYAFVTSIVNMASEIQVDT